MTGKNHKEALDEITAACNEIAALTRLVAFACCVDRRDSLTDADRLAINDAVHSVSAAADRAAVSADQLIANEGQEPANV